MNVAIALGRLGRSVELATWLGADDRADRIARHVEASGVELAPGSRGAPRTSTAAVQLDASGGAQYVFDLLWEFEPPGGVAGFGVVHTGSLATAVEPGATEVAAFFERLKSQAGAVLTFDPNLRPDITPDPRAARPRIEGLVAAADVVKASDEDLRYLYDDRDPVATARSWAREGPALVVLTRGAAGALAFVGPISVNAPAKGSTVADTVGAGDTFMGGLIDGLWSQGLIGAAARPALRSMTETQLLRAMDRAALAAAVTVSRPGADPPWARELA
jgi:fructokinase